MVKKELLRLFIMKMEMKNDSVTDEIRTEINCHHVIKRTLKI